MGIEIPPAQKLSSIPEYRYKRAYIKKAEKAINENLKGLSLAEFSLIRAMVFPVDKSWFPSNQLNTRIAKAMDTLFSNQDLIKYFEVSDSIIKGKLEEWNNFANLPKAEFARKVEGSGYAPGIQMRVIKPYGISYYDFIDFCRIYEKVPVYSCIRDTLIAMKKKQWKGVVTPRICTFLLSGKEMPAMSGAKLKEFVVG